MIVKTGANYQAEGGYIEASKVGNIITVGDGEKSAKIAGSAPYGGFIDLHIINHSTRTLGFTQLLNVPDVAEYLGNPGNNIPPDSDMIIKVPAYIGVKQRVSYSGLGVATWRTDADPSKISISTTSDGYMFIIIGENITNGLDVNIYEE